MFAMRFLENVDPTALITTPTTQDCYCVQCMMHHGTKTHQLLVRKYGRKLLFKPQHHGRPREVRTDLPRLLQLPAELRLQIWELTVTRNEPIAVSQRRPHAIRGVDWDHRKLPSLLHACRQARKEALPIYYSSNTFRLLCGMAKFHLYRLERWLDVIGPEATSNLRHILLARNEVVATAEDDTRAEPTLSVIERRYEVDLTDRKNPVHSPTDHCTDCQDRAYAKHCIRRAQEGADKGVVWSQIESRNLEVLLDSPGNTCVGNVFWRKACPAHTTHDTCAAHLVREVRALDRCIDCALLKMSIANVKCCVSEHVKWAHGQPAVDGDVLWNMWSAVAALGVVWPSRHITD